jgi:hypothetical protein
MTDLQKHVEAPGRADLVKQVSEKIKETGVDYIYSVHLGYRPNYG